MSSLCRTRESRPTGCARVRRALAAGTPRHKDREPEESERADEDHLLLCPREEPAVPSMVHDDKQGQGRERQHDHGRLHQVERMNRMRK